MAKPDPNTFKKPHGWATWCATRTQQFKTHSTLGMCKTAIGSLFTGGGVRKQYGTGAHEYGYPVKGDCYIYKFDVEKDEWVEMYHIPAGSYRHDHPLWQKGVANPSRQVKPPPQKAIDKAIASIMSAHSGAEVSSIPNKQGPGRQA